MVSWRGDLPGRVKIGPVVYEIHYEKNPVGADEDGKAVWLNWRCRINEASIMLDSTLADDMKPVVLLHETMHAILEQAGVEDHPESLVKALGYGIVQMLRENPELVAYLRGQAT